MSLPRMRLIKEAISEIKTVDPETKFTAHALRTLVIEGVVPCVQVGNRRLVDMEVVEDYLKNPNKYNVQKLNDGKIRRLS